MLAFLRKAQHKAELSVHLSTYALNSRGRVDLTDDSAWNAWRVGLVEAVGFLRDGRSYSVLVLASF